MRRGLLALILLCPPAFAGPEDDALLRSAFEAEFDDRRAEALDLLGRYLEKGPESAFLRGQRARLLQAEGRSEEALAEARRAVQVSPGRKEYRLLLAELLRQKGSKEEAVQVLKDSLLSFPDDGEIEFHLAELLADLSRNADALVHYRQALFYNSNAGSRAPAYKSISLLRIAVIRLQARDPRGARPYMERYLQLNPDRVWSRHVLASDIYLSTGRFEDASRELEIIAGTDPRALSEAGIDPAKTRLLKGTIDCYLDRPGCELLEEFQTSPLSKGLLQLYRRQPGPALRTLLPFLRANPQNLFARNAVYRALLTTDGHTMEDVLGLAALCEQFGRYEDALGLLETLNTGTDTPIRRIYRERMVRKQSARLYTSLGRTSRALVEYREALKTGRADDELRTDFSRLIARSEPRLEEALSALQGVGTAQAKLLRASILERLHRCEEALAELDAAGPEASALPYLKASCLDQAGRRQEALAAAKEIYSGRSSDAMAQNFYAYMLALSNADLDDALKLSQASVAQDPDNAAYQDTYGWILFQKKDYARARYHLQFASRLSEEDGKPEPEVYYHVGEVYAALGDRERALYYLGNARRLLSEKNKPGRVEKDLLMKVENRLKEMNS